MALGHLVVATGDEHAAADVAHRLRPVSKRVLARVPGPRALWVVAWALVPWLNAGANLLLETGERSAVWEQSRLVVILNYAALSFAVAVTLVGAERIARRVEALGATTSKVFAGASPSMSFREMDSFLAPLLVAGATALAFGASALIQDGWTAAALRGATWFVVGIPIWSFLWTYGSLQLGLTRLGRVRLRDDVSLVDPGLALRPLGSLAFMGLSLLLVSIVPVLVTGLPDVVGFALGLLVVVGGLASIRLLSVGSPPSNRGDEGKTACACA